MHTAKASKLKAWRGPNQGSKMEGAVGRSEGEMEGKGAFEIELPLTQEGGKAGRPLGWPTG